MRKESRAMDSGWALEVMHKAPYITVSFIDEDGKPYGLPLSLASDDDVNWYFMTAVSPCNTNQPSHSARQKS